MTFGTSRIGTFRFNGGSSLIFVFSGTANLLIPNPTLSGTFQFIRPVYVGQADLKISPVQFVTAEHILPVYTGQANLKPQIIFISAGKNIIEGFIYHKVLYVDTKTMIL